MSEANQSLVVRWARWQTRALARVWPAESRKWGEAIASEAEEIEQPLQAVGWALGGVTVYSRALGAHLLEWLRMPVGERSGAMAPLAGAPGPKRSRLFTVAVLACAAGLLCLPEAREAMTTVKATWEDFAQTRTDKRALEKIAESAEREHDARMMAFAALSMGEGSRKVELAERAVTLDPQLYWIYAAQGRGRGFFPVNQTWSAKLLAADPDNAVPYLLAADAIAKRYQAHGDRALLSEKAFDDTLARDPEWVALMHRGFHAARYDSYFPQHEELNREAWRREPQLSFAPAFEGLWTHSIPNLLSQKRFAALLIGQAREERAAGRLDRAKELLQEVDSFGERMQQPGVTQIERFIGFSVQRQAAFGWKAFYEGTGQLAGAQAATQRLTQIDQRASELASEGRRIFGSGSRREAAAWILEISGMVMMIAAIVAILSIGLFELRPTVWKGEPIARRALCWAADVSPALVLVGCVVFLASFLPYARLIAAFRSGNAGAPNEQQVRVALWGLLDVTRTIAGAEAAVLGWTLLTVVLSLVAALLLARMVYRAMRRTAPQA